MFNIELYLQPKNILEVIEKSPGLAHHEEKFPWLPCLALCCCPLPLGGRAALKGSELQLLRGERSPGATQSFLSVRSNLGFRKACFQEMGLTVRTGALFPLLSWLPGSSELYFYLLWEQEEVIIDIA